MQVSYTTNLSGLLSETSVPSLIEAIPAIDRTVILWLERHFGLFAAVSADNLVHLALLTALTTGAAALFTAVAAAYRLILEPFLRIERLLTSTENEFLAAILAY